MNWSASSRDRIFLFLKYCFNKTVYRNGRINNKCFVTIVSHFSEGDSRYSRFFFTSNRDPRYSRRPLNRGMELCCRLQLPFSFQPLMAFGVECLRFLFKGHLRTLTASNFRQPQTFVGDTRDGSLLDESRKKIKLASFVWRNIPH